MPRNRKRTTNAIEVGSMAKWIVVAVLCAMISLVYVYIKTLHFSYGGDQKRLEKHLVELHQKDEVVSANIVHWSSRTMLKRRLAEGFISLHPIEDQTIVRLDCRNSFLVSEWKATPNQVSYE